MVKSGGRLAAIKRGRIPIPGFGRWRLKSSLLWLLEPQGGGSLLFPGPLSPYHDFCHFDFEALCGGVREEFVDGLHDGSWGG